MSPADAMSPAERSIPKLAFDGRLSDVSAETRARILERRPAEDSAKQDPAEDSAERGPAGAAAEEDPAEDAMARGAAGNPVGDAMGRGATGEAAARRPAGSGAQQNGSARDDSDPRERTEAEVRRILQRVRREGDAALLEMARELDGVELRSLEVPKARWRAALDALDAEVRAALERAATNIERFHHAQLPPEAGDGVEVEVEPGLTLGRRAVPLASAGVYAPGGRAAYPSSVLMGVLPARAAGVGQVVVASPPGPSGEPAAAVLAACALAGADRLFAVGGAGAVAALAYGTATVPRVEAVVGPGNRWVTEAKRQVAGEVVIDAPAGPSEVLVVAEALGTQGRSRARRIALELVAQAEHDPDAQALLVTDDAALLEDVRSALAAEVAATPKRDVVEAALAARGGLLLADTLAEALAFAEAYAAEHLLLLTRDPRRDLSRVTTTGTVLMGDGASVVFGDYMTGANHVLPTAGQARARSGLSTLHFLRFFTWQEVTAEAGVALAGPTARLADAEGLPGHAAAARARGAPGRSGGGGVADGTAPAPAPGRTPGAKESGRETAR